MSPTNDTCAFMSRRWIQPALLAALGALLTIGPIAAPAAGEPARGVSGGPVRFAPLLEKGRVLTYEVERTLRVEQRPDADPRPLITSTTFSAVVRLDVGVVRADGTVEVAVQFQNLTLERDRAGEVVSFSHPRAEAAEGAPKPEDNPLADKPPPSAYETIGTAWAVARPRIVVNREGSVQSMLGVESVLKALETAGDNDASFDQAEIASLSPAALGELLTPVFNPAEPERPTRSFAPGETWSTQRRVDLADLGAIVTTESWSRGPDEAGAVPAEARIVAQAAPPRGIVTAAAVLKLESGAGAASIRWDGAGASLERFEHRLMLGFSVSLGDLKLEQTQVARTVLTRRD